LHPLLANRRLLLAYLAIWAGLGVVPGVLLESRVRAGALVLCVVCTLLLALFSLPTWYLCRALPLALGKGFRIITSHAAAALGWSFVFVVSAKVAVEPLALVRGWHELPRDVERAEGALFGIGALFYFLVASFHYLLTELELGRNAAERAGALALSAQRAELQALRAQVHPHFLFNSLNTVNALIGYDPQKARRACVLLAEYLRGTLRAQERSLVPLREEWALCERYLEVEALRLGARLQVELELPAETHACLVPSLLLQPLVENAMTHGVALVETPLPLRLRARRTVERLVLELENGIDPAPRTRGGGLGLANVRARLFAHYGADATLRIERDDERFVVVLDLPLHAELP
jgi:two-component system sensor histidine kinase AlgZ